jgi:calcium binding protein 39
MAKFFSGKSKIKSPQDLAKAFEEFLATRPNEKAAGELGKLLGQCKLVLYGDSENEPSTELKGQLASELCQNNVLGPLVENLDRLDFEAKKDCALIFNNLVRRQIGQRFPTVEYIQAHDKILFDLLAGYDTPEIALSAGIMLRECIRHESLAKIILRSDKFDSLFRYVELSTFDIASDAYATFKDLLTKHKTMCAEYLDENYDKFFESFMKLLNSENYVTKRQSLKLLGEILLDRANFNTMTKFIGVADNLKLTMNLLRDSSRNIQYEAFHVFKVFVANPNKAKPVLDILLKNKDRLIEYLAKFHTDRSEDEQFNDEKIYLIKQIKELQ